MKRAALLAIAGLAMAVGCAGEKAEGRPWVHDVRWEGTKAKKPGDIAKRLAIEETPWYALFRKRYLDTFTLELDRARIEAWYRAYGYFGARVTRAEAIPRGKEGKSVDIVFAVDEGEPTNLVEVTIEGHEALSALQRRNIERAVKRRLPIGKPLEHGNYVELKTNIGRRLQERGYAFAEVDGRIEVDRDERTARVRIMIAPGPVASIAHVHVQGTERVDPRRVAIRTGLRAGKKFSPLAIEDARARLWNLGVFSSVEVRYEPQEGKKEWVDVIVQVHEGRRNELRLGLGFGLESQRTDIHGSFIYTRFNFLGGLRQLTLKVEPAIVAIPAFWDMKRFGPAGTVEVTLMQPDAIWRDSELVATVGYDVLIEYAYQAHGPRAQFGLMHGFFTRRLQLRGSYGFQFLDFFNTDPTILADPALAGQLYGYVDPYRVAWLSQDVILDLRDKPLDAKKGFYAQVSVEEGGIYTGSAFTYEKITPEARGYVPLGRRVVLAGRGQFGQIFTQGELGSPITRRFYQGGPASHRGFNYNRLSQQVPSGLEGVPPIPIGGDQMILFQAELRFEMFKIAKNWLSLVGFFDAGDVAAPQCGSAACPSSLGRTAINLANLHLAAGGGLRYRTVIGTIRFDLGVRLNRLSDMEADGTRNPDPGSRFAFHISIGEAF